MKAHLILRVFNLNILKEFVVIICMQKQLVVFNVKCVLLALEDDSSAENDCDSLFLFFSFFLSKIYLLGSP